MIPSHLALLAALTGTALGLPNPAATSGSPVRILPFNWRFNITSLKGPGCPDFGAAAHPFVTRPTYGSNTVDGSEIYYWFFAYPHIRASVGPGAPKASVWCETTLSYTELDEQGALAAEPGYRLKLHKNGTEVLASYDLEDGVEAKFRFTYYTDGDGEVSAVAHLRGLSPAHDIDEPVQIVDTLTVAGPRAAGDYQDISPAAHRQVQWALPHCGSGTIKYRTELTVQASKDGAKGSVSSLRVNYEGAPEFYGVQQGVSYGWEKCTV